MNYGFNKKQYLSLPEVKDFSAWLERKLDPPGAFNHHYYLVKANSDWSCSCLYEAYENYWWPYRLESKSSGNDIKGSSFQESFSLLNAIANSFRRAVENGDPDKTIKYAELMLSWGGVLNKNREHVQNMAERAPVYFKKVSNVLNLEQVTLEEYRQVFINSGFTKLYFLLIDNFIMYDGRVGAALGLLGRLYVQEKGLKSIPPAIEFSFGSGKTSSYEHFKQNRRNPSSDKYKLPQFNGRRGRHLKDNIKASWLLKSIADHTKSRFAKLPQEPPLNERLTAIQSALFMVGYDVLSQTDKKIADNKSCLEQSEDHQLYPYKTVAKKYRFQVDYTESDKILCFSYPPKENGKRRSPDYFSLNEIEKICFYLAKNFQDAPFPLANNVVRLTKNKEQPGLGMAIRALQGADVLKAQASSYLGPYLAAVGVFKLEESRPTVWRLIADPEEAVELIIKYHSEV
jgi:hypothetical protein